MLFTATWTSTAGRRATAAWIPAMASSCAASTTLGVTPGLGFLHLPPSAVGRQLAAKGAGGSARGVPRGEPSSSARECCELCAGRDGCRAWFYRAEGKCFLGNCTADGLPCLERLGARKGAAAGVGAADDGVLLCTHPDGAKGAKGSGGPTRRASERATGQGAHGRGLSAASAGRFALLLMGHRNRLMFETLPGAVIAPTVAAGYDVDLFGYLENSTMAKAFRGRRPVGNPAFAALGDADLHETIRALVASAGGRTVDLRIGPRPSARLPDGMPQRLSRYEDGVKQTVATRMFKVGLFRPVAQRLQHPRRRLTTRTLRASGAAGPGSDSGPRSCGQRAVQLGHVDARGFALVRAAKHRALRSSGGARQGLRWLRRLERQGDTTPPTLVVIRLRPCARGHRSTVVSRRSLGWAAKLFGWKACDSAPRYMTVT